MIDTIEQLEESLSRPGASVLEALARAPGDILILGVGGKMGPSLARMARRAADQVEGTRRIIGVSRFSRGGLREELEASNIETCAADLLDPGSIPKLPPAPNIIYMVGRKFGSTGDSPTTWASNSFLPGIVAEHYRHSRIIAFSTGNVYPFTGADSGGPTEDHPLDPVGEYGQSCLGRERIFEYFSRRNTTPVSLIRLNYAIDLRYGIILDLAQKILEGVPIDLSMGHVNVIWQGDANAYALSCLPLASSPPFPLNVTGPAIPVRELALRIGEKLEQKPIFGGSEGKTALLSNASRSWKLFGPPPTSLEVMITRVAGWIRRGGEQYGLPTKFQVRDGKF